MKRLVLLLLPLTAFAADPAVDWLPNATGSAIWQSNVSNGEASWDRIGALQLSADAIASGHYDVTKSDVAHATVHLAADWFPRFVALGRADGGLRADWQHTFGSDAFAPVFRLEGSGDYSATGEAARRGTSGAVTLDLRKKITDTWRAAVRERFDRYAAKSAVFDSRGAETTLEISHDINETTRLSVSGRWRDGDVVTYAQYDRPDLVAVASESATLKTFHRAMTAYRTDARTLGGRIALIHATSDDTAMVLAYDYSHTTRTGLRFANQAVSVSFVQQF